MHDGTYVENINFNGRAITVRSKNGADYTTINGNASGSVVTFDSGEGLSSVLDGFTLTNGGGTFCSGSITCGGGIYCSNSSPTITNCTISDNTATYHDGGISCYSNSSPAITNCIISGNSAGYRGGGIYCSGSSPTITNCTISGNTARQGGGIHCVFSSPTITDSTISGNSVSSLGGGIFCYSSSPSISNCIISNNSSNYAAGAIYSYRSSSPTITNCTISGNSARYYSGGIYCYQYASATVVNSILWENSPNEIYLWYGGSINITYSDIQGGWTGAGNINANPQFVGGGDYHLQPTSPCIDAGTTTGAPEYDFEGDPRLLSVSGDGMPDMGADEYVTPCTDADGDGYAIEGGECGPIDCDDSDANTHPGATEVCDGKDNDCDGRTDEGLLNTYYRDLDGDGYGDPNDITLACSAPSGYVSDNTDNCPNAYNPDQADADGDGIGNVCDTCTDTDGDGYGNPGYPANTCAPDNCPDIANPDQADVDEDGIGDVCDPCDDRPTTGSISPSIDTLWPPNHKMVAVTIDASNLATHNPDTTITVTSVKITEYSRKTGEDIYEENNFEPDVEITGDLSLNLRSERAGKSQGRTYTITVTASDCSGSYAFTTEVVVPHDQGK